MANKNNKVISRDKKKQVSAILEDGRNWISVIEKMPEPGQRVIFRFMSKDVIFGEDKESIHYGEDLKIGRFVQDFNDPTKGTWVIDPPFPRYDYSILSNKDQLKKGAIVTHWTEPTTENLVDWENRLLPQWDYKRLGIFVDPEHEPLLYHALMLGGRYIAQVAGPGFKGEKGQELFACYQILCDMQACIDQNIQVVNSEYIPIDDFLKGELKLCTPSCPGFAEHGDENGVAAEDGVEWGQAFSDQYRPSANEIYDMICRHYDVADRTWLFDTLMAMHQQEFKKDIPKKED